MIKTGLVDDIEYFEATGMLQNDEELNSAINALLMYGFDRSELSLLATKKTVENKLDHKFRCVTRLENDPVVPACLFERTEGVSTNNGAVIGRLIYVGAMQDKMPIVASGGALAAAMAGLVTADDSSTASSKMLAQIFGTHHGNLIEDQLQRGGLLLWVRTWNEDDEMRAVEILMENSAKDIHIHSLESRNYGIRENLKKGIDPVSAIYRGMPCEEIMDGLFLVSDKLFANKIDAFAFIDRHRYIVSLYEDARSLNVDLDAALADPISAFEVPENLLNSSLNDQVKTEVLKRWAYYTRELELASNPDDPVPNKEEQYPDVLRAIEQLAVRTVALKIAS